MKKRIVNWVRQCLGRFAPRCVVIVIFGDGSFLAAKVSRLEPARPRIEVESAGASGARPAACELVANFSGVRIYRLVEGRAPAPLVN
ncbi:MAG TPA: hypothetical protein VNJ12_06685 [Candidatus Dormibacteraeota bacterium]|nr:hypothetical protein [Candidatus Dormibacteraeota bacterium]